MGNPAGKTLAAGQALLSQQQLTVSSKAHLQGERNITGHLATSSTPEAFP
jgi:hypothetical protein